jgi:sugar lactone lactonase YvrE
MGITTWHSRTVVVAALAATAFTGTALSGSAPAHARTAPHASAPVTLPVGPRPESITQGWGGTFYVSIQGAPDLGLNDGEIRTLDPRSGAVTTFVTGLDNPRGLTFTGKFLVVTDTTVVWAIDRQGTKRVLADAAAFPHPIAFLNDAAAEDGGRAVYVTEMGARTLQRGPDGVLWPTDSAQALAIPAAARVYRISMSGAVTEAVTPSRRTLVLNGVTRGSRTGHLLVGDMFYGNLVDVDLRSGHKEIVATGFRAADGLEQARDGTIYVCSFDDGTVWKMDADGENPQLLLEGVGRSSTADLHVDDRGGRLFVPDTLHGTVIVLPI